MKRFSEVSGHKGGVVAEGMVPNVVVAEVLVVEDVVAAVVVVIVEGVVAMVVVVAGTVGEGGSSSQALHSCTQISEIFCIPSAVFWLQNDLMRLLF